MHIIARNMPGTVFVTHLSGGLQLHQPMRAEAWDPSAVAFFAVAQSKLVVLGGGRARKDSILTNCHATCAMRDIVDAGGAVYASKCQREVPSVDGMVKVTDLRCIAPGVSNRRERPGFV